jgi:hypothetical protein
LTRPNRDPARQWLKLLIDEGAPSVVDAQEPHALVWSSLWPVRRDALVRFDLPQDNSGQGTDLVCSLLVEEPEPELPLLGHLRKRLNVIINADLRYSFGQ